MMPSLAVEAIRAVAHGADAQSARIHALEAKVADLEMALGVHEAAFYPRRLSPTQRALFGVLLKRGRATQAQLMTAVYAGRTGADLPTDPDKVFKVQMTKLRQRLAGDAITIETHRADRGTVDATLFRLPPESRERARAIMAREA